jgi:hypothetical protein
MNQYHATQHANFTDESAGRAGQAEKHSHVNGKIILKWIVKEQKGGGDVGWINADQNRERWQALVNAVMNFRFP